MWKKLLSFHFSSFSMFPFEMKPTKFFRIWIDSVLFFSYACKYQWICWCNNSYIPTHINVYKYEMVLKFTLIFTKRMKPLSYVFHKLSTFSNVTLRRGLCIYIRTEIVQTQKWVNEYFGRHLRLHARTHAYTAIQANKKYVWVCVSVYVWEVTGLLTAFQDFLSLLYAIPF